MKRQHLCAVLLLRLLALTGCGGPLAKYDRDRASESTWEISKKSLLGGAVQKYKVKLRTDGPRFRTKFNWTHLDHLSGAATKWEWHTTCDGQHVFVTKPLSLAEANKGMSKSATKWKIDPEFFRAQQFWKSNYLAGPPEDKGSKEIRRGLHHL